MTAIDVVRSALMAHGSAERGGNWNCPGPLHDGGDRKPSLHLTSDSRGVALTCHVGCSVEQITEAIGLSKRDLFNEPAERREVARYVYSRQGRPLFAKVRFEPKEFTIIHPNGSGWVKGIGDSPKVLYRIDEVQAAVDRGEPVYVVEGEKDADRLWELGVAATCNFEGASVGRPKWRAEYSEQLAGADVIIVADRDDAGYAHAFAVKESLGSHANSVRTVQSRTDGKGDDVSDHLDAGYELGQLLPVTRGRVYKTVDLSAVMEAGVAPPVLLCGDLIYAGGLHCIAGAPDCGKTTLALWWALSLMQGGERVLFLDEEGGAEIVSEKMASLGANPLDMRNMMYIPFPGRSWTDDDVNGLCDLAGDFEPSMLLIDSSAAFMARAGLDENVASDVTSWWSRVLSPVARDYNVAVLVIDHDTKSTEQSRFARGSGAKLAGLDVQFKVEMLKPFTRTGNGLLKVHVSKDRRGWLHRDWQVHVMTGGGVIAPQFREWDDTGGSASRISGSDRWPPSRRALFEALNETPCSQVELVNRIVENGGIPLRRETASRELNELLRDGLVLAVEFSGKATMWSAKP